MPKFQTVYEIPSWKNRENDVTEMGQNQANLSLENFVEASLQWHSRLARRTYKSVLTKKCEGREFEPPLEQGFFQDRPDFWGLRGPDSEIPGNLGSC